MGLELGRQANVVLNPTSLLVLWPRKILYEPQFPHEYVKHGK